MNRKYFAALFIVAVVLIVFRVGFSLVQWGDSQDPDPWKVLGDTNKYVITGHYSPSEMQSTYYGSYSGWAFPSFSGAIRKILIHGRSSVIRTNTSSPGTTPRLKCSPRTMELIQ